MKKLVFALTALILALSPAAAQDWPPKNVRIIAPFGANLVFDHE